MSTPTWPAPIQLAPERELPTQIDVDVAIIGAGIHGSALAREFSLRGVSCALLDIGEVGGGTSAGSSKMLHGGIRYLMTGDVAQMREGLAERATWMRIAPKRCQWEAFWMPHTNVIEGLAHRIGIGLYDHWGSERPNWPEALKLGAVPKETFFDDPRSLNSPFVGATAYADLITWDRELTQDLAASSEAQILDFHELLSFDDQGGALQSANIQDLRDGQKRELRAKQWVMALGPWTDETLKAWFNEDSQRLRLSSGIHLWLEAVPDLERPWTLRRPHGRVLFVIPRDGRLLVGTTEREVEHGYAPPQHSEQEELFQALEQYLPAIEWRKLEALGIESAVRPLALSPASRQGEAKSATARMSREAILENHPKFQNLHLVLGGKLTTARALMDQLATKITQKTCPESRTKMLVNHQDRGK